MRFTCGVFRIIKLGFEQTQTKNNSCERGETTQPDASQLADISHSVSAQSDTFAGYGDFIDLSL